MMEFFRKQDGFLSIYRHWVRGCGYRELRVWRFELYDFHESRNDHFALGLVDHGNSTQPRLRKDRHTSRLHPPGQKRSKTRRTPTYTPTYTHTYTHTYTPSQTPQNGRGEWLLMSRRMQKGLVGDTSKRQVCADHSERQVPCVGMHHDREPKHGLCKVVGQATRVEKLVEPGRLHHKHTTSTPKAQAHHKHMRRQGMAGFSTVHKHN